MLFLVKGLGPEFWVRSVLTAAVASLTPISMVLPVAVPAGRFSRAVCKNELRTWYRPASITYGCLIASI